MVISPWGLPRSGMSGSRRTASLDRMSPPSACARAEEETATAARTTDRASAKRMLLGFIGSLILRPILFPPRLRGRPGWGSLFDREAPQPPPDRAEPVIGPAKGRTRWLGPPPQSRRGIRNLRTGVEFALGAAA